MSTERTNSDVSLFTGSRLRVTLDDSSSIARLILTCAQRRNAIDAEFVRELTYAVELLGTHAADTRALLIAAEGPSFTVGGDLEYFYQRLDRLSEELVQMVGSFHESMANLSQLPYPVVCAIQGGAAGGGLAFVWAADIVVAADDLKLVTAFARLGVSGDGGGTWYLPQLVGLRHALQLTLESPTVDAAEALRFGLVTRIVPRDALTDEAEATAAKLAAGPTKSLALQRKLLRAASARAMRDGLLAEVDAMRISGHTNDAREGMAAFVEHRPPKFLHK